MRDSFTASSKPAWGVSVFNEGSQTSLMISPQNPQITTGDKSLTAVLEPVQRARVCIEDLAALGFGQRRPEGVAWIVEIPVRIVRREQQAIDADPLDQRAQMSCFIRLVDRLRREPEMLLHIFRRTTLEMRHLAAEGLEMPVHAPGRRRDPAEPALDEDDLQVREAFGNAFEHEAGKLRRHGVRVRLVLLDIIRRPAAAGRRMAAIAADVDAERQAQFLRAGVDRPVAAAAERLVGAWADIDLHIAADLGAALDLGDRQLRVVLAGEDGGLQPRIAVGPECELPVVDGALDRGAEFEVLLREDEEVEHLQDAVFDIEGIKMLLAHELEIGARRPAGRRPRIAARDQRRGARIRRGADIGRAQMAAISAQVLLPAFRHELLDIGMRMDARMHVAIDDAQPAFGGFFLSEDGAVDDVTHAILLQSKPRASAAERSLTGYRR